MTAPTDVIPILQLRWNAGVGNFLLYGTGDLPAGQYDRTSLSNTGIGHFALDGGVGYTYLDPKTGHEFSVVAGFTHNYINPYTQYMNGTDLHVDWGASQFLTKQLLIGAVGYVYDRSPATAEVATASAPSNHASSASARRLAISFRSEIIRDI